MQVCAHHRFGRGFVNVGQATDKPLVEPLERRLLHSATSLPTGPTEIESNLLATAQPLIVSGDSTGASADSPTNRIDPNVPGSAFAGVGSLRIVGDSGSFICSATAIGSRHVLTAGHCLDLAGDGTVDVIPENVTFNLNFDGDLSHPISANGLVIHPDYTGFRHPSVNDDIAVVSLSQNIPDDVPIYTLNTDPLNSVATITVVGYGRSGDGINGFTDPAKFSVKRVGLNQADMFRRDDERRGTREVFMFDFDGPDASTSFSGGLTLGNNIETTLGGGDSGGPSFIDDGAGQMEIFGVNTFGFGISGGPAPPRFGSGGGGMIVSAYAGWIRSVTESEATELVSGDINGDGVVNNLDIDAFIKAQIIGGDAADIGNGAAFVTIVPGGNFGGADVNRDGEINNLDLGRFAEVLAATAEARPVKPNSDPVLAASQSAEQVVGELRTVAVAIDDVLALVARSLTPQPPLDSAGRLAGRPDFQAVLTEANGPGHLGQGSALAEFSVSRQLGAMGSVFETTRLTLLECIV